MLIGNVLEKTDAQAAWQLCADKLADWVRTSWLDHTSAGDKRWEEAFHEDPNALPGLQIEGFKGLVGLDYIFINKIIKTAEEMRPPFIAIVGSPVPAIIGTDYASICKEVEDSTNIPCISVSTTGFNDYARGIEKSYLALERFIEHEEEKDDRLVNIIGYNVVDYYDDKDLEVFKKRLESEGYRVNCVLGNSPVEDIRHMTRAGINLVVSTSGLKYALSLQRRFGMPMSVDFSLADGKVERQTDVDVKVMIIGDQIISNVMRGYLEAKFGCECDVVTFFTFEKSLGRPNDAKVYDEFDFNPLLDRGYDLIIGDPTFRSILPEDMNYVDIPHPAVSSRLYWDRYIPLFSEELRSKLDDALMALGAGSGTEHRE